jgi:hypothetical protein
MYIIMSDILDIPVNTGEWNIIGFNRTGKLLDSDNITEKKLFYLKKDYSEPLTPENVYGYINLTKTDDGDYWNITDTKGYWVLLKSVGSDDVPVNLEFDEDILTGNVTDGYISGATAKLYDLTKLPTDSEYLMEETVTNSEGTYRFNKPPPELFKIEIEGGTDISTGEDRTGTKFSNIGTKEDIRERKLNVTPITTTMTELYEQEIDGLTETGDDLKLKKKEKLTNSRTRIKKAFNIKDEDKIDKDFIESEDVEMTAVALNIQNTVDSIVESIKEKKADPKVNGTDTKIDHSLIFKKIAEKIKAQGASNAEAICDLQDVSILETFIPEVDGDDWWNDDTTLNTGGSGNNTTKGTNRKINICNWIKNANEEIKITLHPQKDDKLSTIGESDITVNSATDDNNIKDQKKKSYIERMEEVLQKEMYSRDKLKIEINKTGSTDFFNTVEALSGDSSYFQTTFKEKMFEDFSKDKVNIGHIKPDKYFIDNNSYEWKHIDTATTGFIAYVMTKTDNNVDLSAVGQILHGVSNGDKVDLMALYKKGRELKVNLSLKTLISDPVEATDFIKKSAEVVSEETQESANEASVVSAIQENIKKVWKRYSKKYGDITCSKKYKGKYYIVAKKDNLETYWIYDDRKEKFHKTKPETITPIVGIDKITVDVNKPKFGDTDITGWTNKAEKFKGGNDFTLGTMTGGGDTWAAPSGGWSSYGGFSI